MQDRRKVYLKKIKEYYIDNVIDNILSLKYYET